MMRKLACTVVCLEVLLAPSVHGAAIKSAVKQAPTPEAAPPLVGAGASAAGTYGPVTRTDTLWSLAERFRPDETVSVQRTMLALLEANPDAFTVQNLNALKVGAVLRIPTRAEIGPNAKTEAIAEVRRQHAAWRTYRESPVGHVSRAPEGAAQPAEPIPEVVTAEAVAPAPGPAPAVAPASLPPASVLESRRESVPVSPALIIGPLGVVSVIVGAVALMRRRRAVLEAQGAPAEERLASRERPCQDDAVREPDLVIHGARARVPGELASEPARRDPRDLNEAPQSTKYAQRHVWRPVLVGLWLVSAVGCLWVNQPGFWRSSVQRFERAQTLRSESRVSEAIEEMSRAIRQDPSNVGFRVYKGYLGLQAEQLAGAERTFRGALELRPDVEATLGLAESLALQGRLSEGRESLDALDGASLMVEQRYRRQALYAQTNDFQAALRDRGLLETGLDDPARLRNALQWAMGAQDWGLAIRLADRVLAAAKDAMITDEAILHKAVALRASGRLEAALELFESLPNDTQLMPRAELALQLERFAGAADLYRAAVAERPRDPEVRLALGYALDKSGQYQDAVIAYREALALAEDRETRVRLVTLLNAMRRYAEAWEALAPVPRPATTPDLVRLQARTALWAGQLADAIDLFEAIPDTTRDDNAAEGELAFQLARGGRSADAQRVYERLFRENRADQLAVIRFAGLLNTQHRYEDAWRTVRAVSADVPSDEVLELHAWTAFWARDYPAASRLLEAWLERRPDNAAAWRDAAEAVPRICGSTPATQSRRGDVPACWSSSGVLRRRSMPTRSC